jgi:hypothetical protein
VSAQTERPAEDQAVDAALDTELQTLAVRHWKTVRARRSTPGAAGTVTSVATVLGGVDLGALDLALAQVGDPDVEANPFCTSVASSAAECGTTST